MMGDAGPDASEAVMMLQAVARAVIDRVDVLTDADLAIGDGDHGIGMRRGFEAALVALDAGPATIDAAFRATGMAIMANTGGAAGAVFGTLFTAGAKAFSGADRMDADGIRHFLAAAQEGVAKRGGVTEGQKTMLDALAHSARACSDASSLTRCLSAAAQGAEAGVEATKSMIATTGKARALGERSLGHPDPGAISVAIILTAMRDFVAAGATDEGDGNG
jgi:phosphoenolpyruvate---glycerone phosphotransferase subunit DhaL